MNTNERSITYLFNAKASEYKDRIAFNYFDGKWKTITYGEFLGNAEGVASLLTKNGIRKGDRIAIISENRPEWCIAYLAISMSGGIAVPIDVQLGPAEIGNLLTDSESKLVFCSSKTEENVMNISDAFVPDRSRLSRINFDSPEFKDICTTHKINNYPGVSEEDVASIIYTSGTTGIPKGVELTHKNFCSDADAIIKIELLTHNDNVLSILPLHHTYPFMCTFLVPLFLGATITYPPSLKGPELMGTIRDRGVSVLVGVPQLLELFRNGVLNKMKELPGPLPTFMTGILKFCGSLRRNSGINMGKLIFKSAHDAIGKRFRFFASGGAKLDPQVMMDLEALGFTVLEGYGLTETSPVVTFNPIRKRKPGSAGRPFPSVEIKTMDPENHEELGPMKEGEIAIKGPMVMKGYYRNPQATEQVLRKGWFYSGDLGYLDDDGYLFITGRLKEVIVLSSGKNIYPEEVEKRYLKIPLIKEICIIGVEEKGIIDSLQAIIVPDFDYAKGARIGNLQESLKWEINDVSLRLPQFMRIKGYTVYPGPLPRTPLGKLRRFMIKDLLKIRSEKLKVKSEIDRKLLEDEIGSKVVKCLTPLLKEKINIQSADNLELDLGLDSLARIELVVALEQAFSMKLPETFTSEIQTVGELVTKIKEHGASVISRKEKAPVWKDILSVEPAADDRKKVILRYNPLVWPIILFALSLIKSIARVFFRLKVEGIDKLPETGPYIITPNHASYLDAFIVVSALPSKSFRDLYILGLQHFFAGRFMQSFARIAHVIPIDTELYLNRALQTSSYILRKGKSLLIFPEGGRSYDGELLDFKKGVGILSTELDIPIVPALIKGSFDALPRGAMRPRFTGIKISFGKPLHPSDIDLTKKPEGMDNYQFFVSTLKEKVKELK